MNLIYTIVIDRRYKLISSQILTDQDFITMARERYELQGRPYTDEIIKEEAEKLVKQYIILQMMVAELTEEWGQAMRVSYHQIQQNL